MSALANLSNGARAARDSLLAKGYHLRYHSQEYAVPRSPVPRTATLFEAAVYRDGRFITRGQSDVSFDDALRFAHSFITRIEMVAHSVPHA